MIVIKESLEKLYSLENKATDNQARLIMIEKIPIWLTFQVCVMCTSIVINF